MQVDRQQQNLNNCSCVQQEQPFHRQYLSHLCTQPQFLQGSTSWSIKFIIQHNTVHSVIHLTHRKPLQDIYSEATHPPPAEAGLASSSLACSSLEHCHFHTSPSEKITSTKHKNWQVSTNQSVIKIVIKITIRNTVQLITNLITEIRDKIFK